MSTSEQAPARASFQATLAAARSGDDGARERLCLEFLPTVRQMVHASLARDLRSSRPWLHAQFSTGDVVQEVFQSVLLDLNGFQGTDERSFAGYLAMIVRNRLIDAIRFHEAARRDRRRNGPSVEAIDLRQRTCAPPEQAASAEEVGLFAQVLTSFEPREQQLLRERIERQTPFAELTQLLAFPSPDAARKAFYVAQARLVTRLRSAGLGGPAVSR